MKKIYFAGFVFFAAVFFCSAEGIAEEARKGNEKADVSYAFGQVVASDLVGTGLEFNYDAFIMGFRQTLEKEETRYTADEAMNLIQTAFAAAQAELAEKNRVESAAFLAENGKRPGVVITPSGLQYEVLVEGNGKTPAAGDSVLVHYRGTDIAGTEFDTTYDSGEPVEIPLERVIPGWSEGIRMMKEGGKAKLFIPSNLAYGERGAGGAIGPNKALIFDVELLSVLEPEPPVEEVEEVPEDEDAAADAEAGE